MSEEEKLTEDEMKASWVQEYTPRRIGKMSIPETYLEGAEDLNRIPKLPPGSKVHRLYYDYLTDTICVLFKNEQLPECKEGDSFPHYSPFCVSYPDGSYRIYWPVNWVSVCRQSQ